MSGTTRVGVLRVDAQGVVVGADPVALELLGRCLGSSCRRAVAAVDREDEPVCTAGCAAELTTSRTARRETEGVVVRDRVGRLTCTRVGDETVVVVEAGPLRARSFPELLTPREREVLGQIALGRTNRQIAATLDVSPSTVRTHVEHLLAKLGASTRTQAVVVGRALGELAA